MSIDVFDSRVAAVARGAGELQRLCTGAVWSEGPVWMREDHSLLWSDIPNLVFGGADGDEIFICAGTSLYRVRLNTRGATA